MTCSYQEDKSRIYSLIKQTKGAQNDNLECRLRPTPGHQVAFQMTAIVSSLEIELYYNFIPKKVDEIKQEFNIDPNQTVSMGEFLFLSEILFHRATFSITTAFII